MITKQNALYFAWLVASTASLFSLYLSELQGIVPCKLCWYQRSCLFPLPIILFQAVYNEDTSIVRYILPLPFLGALIAAFQLYYAHSICQTCVYQEKVTMASGLVFVIIMVFLIDALFYKKKKTRKSLR